MNQETALEQNRFYFEGVREGISRYAVWKDGVQYVGSTGRTLADAIAITHTQESQETVRIKAHYPDSPAA